MSDFNLPQYLEARGWKRDGEWRWTKGDYELTEPADDKYEIWFLGATMSYSIFMGTLATEHDADVVMRCLGIT